MREQEAAQKGRGSAREAAYQTLVATESRVFSDLRLRQTSRQMRLDAREAAFAAYLCYGVLENRLLLDHHIGRFSKIRIKKLETRVLALLRLGAFQLFFADGVPPSAAVNETVALARRFAERSAGFINAVLRSLANVADPRDVALTGEERLSVLYSHPLPLVAALRARVGESELEAALAVNQARPPVTAALNTLKLPAEAIDARLRDEGAEPGPVPGLSGMRTLTGTGAVDAMDAFRDGLFFVQDAASHLAVRALAPKENDRVLDLCAAPGGKTFAAALLMSGIGEIVANDVHPHKQKLIEAGAKRLGLTCISTSVYDGGMKNDAFSGKFDAVICDVPCSGLGIIRKKPDVRYKDLASFAELPALQRRLLDTAADALRPGGRLLYSTCTWRREENEDVVGAFLRERRDFRPEAFELPAENARAEDGRVTLWPHIHGTDGFFICLMRKKDV